MLDLMRPTLPSSAKFLPRISVVLLALGLGLGGPAKANDQMPVTNGKAPGAEVPRPTPVPPTPQPTKPAPPAPAPPAPDAPAPPAPAPAPDAPPAPAPTGEAGAEAPKADAPPPEITVKADSIEMFLDKGQAVFVGHVRATDQNIELRADRMVVTFDDQQRITHIEAESNVVVIHESGRASGGRAKFALEEGVLRLFENPVIEQPGSRIEGAEEVEYNRTAGVFRTHRGSPRITITPKDPVPLAPNPILPKPRLNQ